MTLVKVEMITHEHYRDNSAPKNMSAVAGIVDWVITAGRKVRLLDGRPLSPLCWQCKIRKVGGCRRQEDEEETVVGELARKSLLERTRR